MELRHYSVILLSEVVSGSKKVHILLHSEIPLQLRHYFYIVFTNTFLMVLSEFCKTNKWDVKKFVANENNNYTK